VQAIATGFATETSMKDALSLHHVLLERQTVHEIIRLPRGISSADELPEVLDLPPGRCLCTRLYARPEECLLAAAIVGVKRKQVEIHDSKRNRSLVYKREKKKKVTCKKR